MTVETKTDLSQIATAELMINGSSGESSRWDSQLEQPPKLNEESAVTLESPRVSWPRIFPGL